MSGEAERLRPDGIAGSSLAGPFPVGAYAEKLREELRKRARVQLFGEVWNLRASKAKVYFELRDGDGAVPCSMWRDAFERLGLRPGPQGSLADGVQVVVAGGPDYYPGSRTSSPAFSFDVTNLRVAGEGDLLAQLEALRRTLAAAGLFEPQKALPRPTLPRCIGVVTGEGGKARDDVLAGLRRRGWAGRLVWAFAPVQDRHAAPRITRALQDLAAVDEVEVIVVARGGGSLADLFAFCDETLCRTVAMLRVPVIASVGHHTDRTLIDDVAAVSCSTPTHAAESAVPCHLHEARASLARCAAALDGHARRAVLHRARHLAGLSRAPAHAVERHRAALHQRLRELRASARRRIDGDARTVERRAGVLARKALAAAGPEAQTRRAALDGLAAALAAHDPERTVARGYAIVDDGDGGIVSSAARARELGDVRLFFADGPVRAQIDPDQDDQQEERP
ncbi:MAG TPA: exodeoxyribonuclease VII large subunit [Baekduia sp.]|nr:exodeoxyribonuclease VII large subunit [Baekduia sp.]